MSVENEYDKGFGTGALCVLVVALLAFAAFVFWGLPDWPIPDSCGDPTRLYEPDGSYVLTYECEAPK